MSFESEKLFNDFHNFARGIRRSGEFSIRESNILEKYGWAMMDLHKGLREPKDEVEKQFLEQLHGNDIITDENAKVFAKYLKVIQPRRLHRLCAIGSDDEITTDFGGGSGSADDSID